MSRIVFWTCKAVGGCEIVAEKVAQAQNGAETQIIKECGEVRVLHEDVIVDVVFSSQGQAEKGSVKYQIQKEHAIANAENDGRADKRVLFGGLYLAAFDKVNAPKG